MKNNKTIIYTLDCPRTGLVKYVGKSNLPLNTKLNHLITASKINNSKLSKWLQELLEDGLKPTIVHYKYCSKITADKEVEKLIKYLVKTEHSLLNNIYGKKIVVSYQISKGVIELVKKRAKKEGKANQELIEEILIKELA